MIDQEAIDITAIESSYRDLIGAVPASVAERIRIAEATNRSASVIRIEELRRQLITNNPLDPKTAQLVHFAQLLALGEEQAAQLHASAAQLAGATFEELTGVIELALITAGMPAYSRGIAILGRLFPGDQP